MFDANAEGPQLVTVAEGVYAWIGFRGDSNAGAIETPDGLLAVDAQQFVRLARQFRDALTAATGRPVHELVNTHSHLDHTAGNAVFEDVPILAHERTHTAMQRQLGPANQGRWRIKDHGAKLKMLFGDNVLELVPPSHPDHEWFRQRIAGPDYETVELVAPTRSFADEFCYLLPNETVRLRYLGPAHSDNDIIVHLERSRVVFLGDLMFYGRFPWLGDCDLDGWIARLDHVLTLDVAVVIPGHGPPTDLKQAAEFRGMLVALREAVAHAIKAGSSEEAAVREVRLPRYAAIQRYEDWLSHDVRAAYRYLRGAAGG